MKVPLRDLPNRLTSGLPSVVLVESDEPLLSMDACDLIRSAVLELGFERQVIDAGPGFNSNQLMEARNELSLFATETLIELRFAKPKLDAKTVKALLFYLEDPPPEKRLVIQIPALGKDERKKAWVNKVDQLGWVVSIPKVGLDGFDKFLREELNRVRVRLDDEARELLRFRVEGNTLAARQEVEKLTLFAGDQPMTAQELASITGESARYTVFDLIDNCLRGDIQRVAHICRTLEAEGVSPLEIMGLLNFTLEGLSILTRSPNDWRTARVFNTRSQDNYRLALRRINQKSLLPILQQASRVDRAIKGQSPTPAWLSLTQLALKLAGANIPAS